jgi:prolyl 4-hydroxylase
MKEVFLLAVVLVILTCILVLLTRNTERGFTREDASWEHPQILKDVLTPNECQYIIDKAAPMFTRSTVVGIEGADSARTSQTAWIPKTDPVAQKVFAKALEFTDKTLDECEDLQVVRYEPGTYYKEHTTRVATGLRGALTLKRKGGNESPRFSCT